jgi:hypothetical protein
MSSYTHSGIPTDQGRRRSARVLVSVPVMVHGANVAGQAFDEEARTLVVNAHGALIALTESVKSGQNLTLTNKMTKQVIETRVVYVGKPQGDKSQVGIEFSKPAPAFWQIDFPPDDWVVPEN